MLDFPRNARVGQRFHGDGTQWIWDGQKWTPGGQLPGAWHGGGESHGFGDAPFDGMWHGRRNGRWEPVLPASVVYPAGELRLDLASVVLDFCGEIECVREPSVIAPNLAGQRWWLNAYPHKMHQGVYLTDGGAGMLDADFAGNIRFRNVETGARATPLPDWKHEWQFRIDGNFELPMTSTIEWHQPAGSIPVSISGSTVKTSNQLVLTAGSYELHFNASGDPVYNFWVGGVINGSVANITSQGSFWARQDITAGRNAYVTSNLYLNPFGSWEWNFVTDLSGNKIENYRSQWYDMWRSSDGMRLWYSPVGDVMQLDGNGNLTVMGSFVTDNGTVSAANGNFSNNVNVANDLAVGEDLTANVATFNTLTVNGNANVGGTVMANVVEGAEIIATNPNGFVFGASANAYINFSGGAFNFVINGVVVQSIS